MLFEGELRYQEFDRFNRSSNSDSVIFFSKGWIGFHDNSLKKSAKRIIICVKGREGIVERLQDGAITTDKTIASFDAFKQYTLRVENAVAIGFWYDSEFETISVFRDPFGSVPFYYCHLPNKGLWFSTDLRRLLKMCEVRNGLEVNNARILGFLHDADVDLTDTSWGSFFSNISTAPPGHLLTISTEGSTVHRHLCLAPEKWSGLRMRDYAERLRELLKQSVITATTGSAAVASHLSGGLDSSSLCSIYRHLYPDRSLDTLHLLSDNVESDESAYASAVAESIHSRHHNMRPSFEDLAMLSLSTELYGQPEHSYFSPATNVASISFLAQQGCDVLLTGYGGDSVIGTGIEAMRSAFREQRWNDLQDLLKKRVPFSYVAAATPNWQLLSFDEQYKAVTQQFIYNQLSSVRETSVLDYIQELRMLRRKLGLSPSYLWKKAVNSLSLRLKGTYAYSPVSMASEEFAASCITHMGESLTRRLSKGMSATHQELFDDVFSSYVVRVQEQHFALGNHFGIDIETPYMNLELLELCMAIPDVMKFGNGRGRDHFRQAMHGILPEVTRTRTTKATLTTKEGEDMTKRMLSQSEDFLLPSAEVWKYVDKRKFNSQVKILNNSKIPTGWKNRPYIHINRTISLAVWLDWLSRLK